MANALTCISGALIATFDSDGELLRNTDFWIRDGRILALMSAGAPAPADGPIEMLMFDRALVMPGLINAYTHSSSALRRGTTGGAPLDLYLMEATARPGSASLPKIRVSVLRLAMEMLKAGVTGVIDHFGFGEVPDAEAVSTAFSAYTEIGIRAAVAPMYQDLPYIESLPIDMTVLPTEVAARWRNMKPASPESYFAMMDEVVKKWGGRHDLKVLIGVEGPQRCTARPPEMTGDFAARHGIGYHTHLLESKTQAMIVPPGCGGSFVAYLDRFGLINPKSSLANFVWCTERDIEVAAERGVNVVNNPFQQSASRQRHPANGTDSRGRRQRRPRHRWRSWHQTSLFEKARLSALLSRISQIDETRWIRAQQALRMATVNGAAVLGEAGTLGVIHPGAFVHRPDDASLPTDGRSVESPADVRDGQQRRGSRASRAVHACRRRNHPLGRRRNRAAEPCRRARPGRLERAFGLPAIDSRRVKTGRSDQSLRRPSAKGRVRK